MTKRLCLTRVRQDVSAGTCVAATLSPPRQHTSCSSKAITATAAIANLLHRACMPWILEHPCDSWLWDVAKNPDSCGTTSHGLGACGFLFVWLEKTCSAKGFRVTLTVSGWECGRQRFAPDCSQMCWNVHPKNSPSRSECSSSRGHTHPARLSFTLAMIPTINARRFQRTHLGSSLNASRDVGMGVTDLAPIRNQSQ